jgi:hypothetical protein
MKATNKLRFVERSQPDYPGSNTGRIVRILQQWWEVENPTDALHNNVLDGEWRDVPVEVEA